MTSVLVLHSAVTGPGSISTMLSLEARKAGLAAARDQLGAAVAELQRSLGCTP